MAFAFKTVITAKFAVWLAAVGGGVTVINGDDSTDGIVSYNVDVELGESLSAPKTGTVRVLADNIGTVAEDGTVSVDGTRVFVQRVGTDAAGAVTTIEFSDSQPVPDDML